MKIEIDATPKSLYAGNNWVEGKTEDGHAFEAKVFLRPSRFGIETPRFVEGGNVSKLRIEDSKGEEVACYDRGWWNGYPDDEDLDIVHEIVLELERIFCTE